MAGSIATPDRLSASEPRLSHAAHAARTDNRAQGLPIPVAAPAAILPCGVPRVVSDARDYMLALPAPVADHQAWQYAGKLLLAAAEAPGRATIEDVTRQIELALFTTGRQDMTPMS
jgi:hypothetical protein